MKTHADCQSVGKMPIAWLAGKKRRPIAGRRPGCVASMLHEIALRFGRIEPFARRHEGGPFAIEVDQLLGDGLTLRRVAMQKLRRTALAQHRSELPAEI